MSLLSFSYFIFLVSALWFVLEFVQELLVTFKDISATVCGMLDQLTRGTLIKATFSRDRICSDPFGIGSTLFTWDRFKTGAVRFHIGSHKWTHLV